MPEDLTVIGFDDIPAAGWPLIGLTTMRCDLAELARTAVELLLAQLDGATGEFPQRRLPPVLVERQTHARRARTSSRRATQAAAE